MMNCLGRPPMPPSPKRKRLLLLDDDRNEQRPAKATKISHSPNADPDASPEACTCTCTYTCTCADGIGTNDISTPKSDWIIEIEISTVMSEESTFEDEEENETETENTSMSSVSMIHTPTKTQSHTHNYYTVNKATLAASSDYFGRLFQQQEPTTTGDSSNKSHFEMPALMANQFPQLLQFFHAAAAAAPPPPLHVTHDETTLTITTETATALHSLAIKFGVDKLCTQTQVFIQRDVSLETMDRYHYDADVCDNSIVVDMVVQFFTKNILQVPPSAAIVHNLTLEQWKFVLTNVYDVVDVDVDVNVNVQRTATKTQVSCHLSELLAEVAPSHMERMDLETFQALTAPDKIPMISHKAVVRLLQTEQDLLLLIATSATTNMAAVPSNSNSNSNNSTLQTRCLAALVPHLIQQGTLLEEYATLFRHQSPQFLTTIIAQLTEQYQTFVRTETIKSQQIATECDREVKIAKASRMEHLKAWKKAQQQIQELKRRLALYEGSNDMTTTTRTKANTARVTPQRPDGDPRPIVGFSSNHQDQKH